MINGIGRRPGRSPRGGPGRGQEREVNARCFARLCKDDVINIGSTQDDPRRYLSKLKAEVGPIREVTWLDDDHLPQGWGFGHLSFLYPSQTGGKRGVHRADLLLCHLTFWWDRFAEPI